MMNLNKTYGISLDDECTLVSYEKKSKLGTQSEEVKTTVFCCVKDVPQSEFNVAGQQDIKTEYVFYVSVFDYSGQKKIKYDGNVFSVYRSYARARDELVELYCERRSGA